MSNYTKDIKKLDFLAVLGYIEPKQKTEYIDSLLNHAY
jgi:hypothetical protein